MLKRQVLNLANPLQNHLQLFKKMIAALSLHCFTQIFFYIFMIHLSQLFLRLVVSERGHDNERIKKNALFSQVIIAK